MTNSEQERWSRVKGRLRSTVGEDVYTSWFARMDLEAVQDESVHLSVPTRFLGDYELKGFEKKQGLFAV